MSLSSGEVFYVNADPDEMQALFSRRALVKVGGRWVNATQVAQLTEENVPSIETAEEV